MRDLVTASQKSILFVGCFALFWSACAPSCNEKKETTVEVASRLAVQKGAHVDGKRALTHVQKIIALGPRQAGTVGAEKTRQYIYSYLRELGLSPKRHDFTAFTPHPDLSRVEMANITVDFDGPGEKKLLIGGHFDGKILPGIQFQGANDGGSSTALLLELARVLASDPPPCPVRLAFFDGEEALLKWGDADSLYGSKHMAAELRESGEDKSFAAVVIVDMIGDKNLRLNWDRASSPRVLGTIAQTAKRLGYDTLFKGPRNYIADDHIPFKLIGIPAGVLIDLNFGPGWTSNAYWHTDKDTIDKLSPLSFESVGIVLLKSLPELARL